ncbi:MAG: hypothetical protein COV67_01200 [Nitrospinae bacterium CG11_big_fil_rev_8_21_14_0_20_56_8]|nr:MAG: hypothetical protein COV67_01200 [Nitrospinae bacterium CG11_big_fil_rev_8_21_14_0_20_56_8]
MTRFIYLHGFASGPQSTKARAFKQAFALRGLPLQVPDLEGGDFQNLTLSSQMKILDRCLDDSPEPAALIGSSMGGYLAALAAERRPEVVGLYLMAPGFNFLKRWGERHNIAVGNFNSIPPLIQVFHYRYNSDKSLSSKIFSDAEAWAEISFARKIPIRIVHGIHDETVDIRESREFAKLRSWVEFEEIDSDHGLASHVDWVTTDGMAFFHRSGFF